MFQNCNFELINSTAARVAWKQVVSKMRQLDWTPGQDPKVYNEKRAALEIELVMTYLTYEVFMEAEKILGITYKRRLVNGELIIDRLSPNV